MCAGKGEGMGGTQGTAVTCKAWVTWLQFQVQAVVFIFYFITQSNVVLMFTAFCLVV